MASSSRRASPKSCLGYSIRGGTSCPREWPSRKRCWTLAGQLTRVSTLIPRATATMRASRAAWWAMSGASAFTSGAAPKWPSVAAIFVVQALVERLALHLVAGLLRQPRGQLVGGAGDLVAQLEVVRQPLRVQGAGLDRGAHRAAGLAVVAAVTEFALFGQRLDVGETALGQVLLAGGLEFAHAGGVDQAGARRQRDQRAVGGGVAAARVAFAHAGGLDLFDSEQCVGQRGRAGAGAADQHRGHARP